SSTVATKAGAAQTPATPAGTRNPSLCREREGWGVGWGWHRVPALRKRGFALSGRPRSLHAAVEFSGEQYAVEVGGARPASVDVAELHDMGPRRESEHCHAGDRHPALVYQPEVYGAHGIADVLVPRPGMGPIHEDLRLQAGAGRVRGVPHHPDDRRHLPVHGKGPRDERAPRGGGRVPPRGRGVLEDPEAG